MAMNMTEALIVGADRLGNLPDLLKEHNITIRHHVTGRETKHQKKSMNLPSGIHLVILFTDFLGHNVMRSFRAAANQAGIKIVACKRSKSSMQQALEQCGYCARNCAGCPMREQRRR